MKSSTNSSAMATSRRLSGQRVDLIRAERAVDSNDKPFS
jgi:hypothetical protein